MAPIKSIVQTASVIVYYVYTTGVGYSTKNLAWDYNYNDISETACRTRCSTVASCVQYLSYVDVINQNTPVCYLSTSLVHAIQPTSGKIPFNIATKIKPVVTPDNFDSVISGIPSLVSIQNNVPYYLCFSLNPTISKTGAKISIAGGTDTSSCGTLETLSLTRAMDGSVCNGGNVGVFNCDLTTHAADQCALKYNLLLPTNSKTYSTCVLPCSADGQDPSNSCKLCKDGFYSKKGEACTPCVFTSANVAKCDPATSFASSCKPGNELSNAGTALAGCTSCVGNTVSPLGGNLLMPKCSSCGPFTSQCRSTIDPTIVSCADSNFGVFSVTTKSCSPPTTCPAGKIIINLGTSNPTYCQSCTNPNTYSPGGTSQNCPMCPVGAICSNGILVACQDMQDVSQACSPCNSGTYSKSGDATCSKCSGKGVATCSSQNIPASCILSSSMNYGFTGRGCMVCPTNSIPSSSTSQCPCPTGAWCIDSIISPVTCLKNWHLDYDGVCQKCDSGLFSVHKYKYNTPYSCCPPKKSFYTGSDSNGYGCRNCDNRGEDYRSTQCLRSEYNVLDGSQNTSPL